MSQTQTLSNGDSSSKLIDNLYSLPVVSSSVSTFKSNPYGAKSLDLTQETYNKLIAPYLPYAQRPYSYISPYVAKADSLASDGLTRVEKQFPIVTEQPSVIKKTLLAYARAPFDYLEEGRAYLFSTYDSEYQKCGGSSSLSSSSASDISYLAAFKALITTALVIASDLLAWLSAYIGQKQKESRDFASAKYHQAQTIASQASRYANEKGGEAVHYAHEKGEQAKNYAYSTGREANEQAKKTKEKATK